MQILSIEEFKNLIACIQGIVSIIAIIVGAYWTYIKFIDRRENQPKIEFTLDINFLGTGNGKLIVELIAYLVRHKIRVDSFYMKFFI